MKKVFYFALLMLTLAYACRKVDEPEYAAQIRCWPIGIGIIDTTADSHDTTSIAFAYDEKNYLINYDTENVLYAFENDTIRNLIVKKLEYSSLGVLTYSTIYLYDDLKRLIKASTYVPLGMARKGLKSKTSEEINGTLYAEVYFTYDTDSKYPKLIEKRLKNRDKVFTTSYTIKDNNVVNEVTQYFKDDLISAIHYERTYDSKVNIFSAIGNNSFIFDNLYTSNNFVTERKVVYKKVNAGEPADSVVTSVKNEIKYNRYGYPEVITNENGTQIIGYKVDSLSLK